MESKVQILMCHLLYFYFLINQLVHTKMRLIFFNYRVQKINLTLSPTMAHTDFEMAIHSAIK